MDGAAALCAPVFELALDTVRRTSARSPCCTGSTGCVPASRTGPRCSCWSTTRTGPIRPRWPSSPTSPAAWRTCRWRWPWRAGPVPRRSRSSCSRSCSGTRAPGSCGRRRSAEPRSSALLRAETGDEPDEAFVDACLRRDRGQPLPRARARPRGRRAWHRSLGRGRRAGPRARPAHRGAPAARAARRARRPLAVEVVRAVAVLGADADVRRIARLARPAGRRRGPGARRARGRGRPDRRAPVEFVHPIARSAIYAAIPAGERARLHAVAAALLRDGGRRDRAHREPRARDRAGAATRRPSTSSWPPPVARWRAAPRARLPPTCAVRSRSRPPRTSGRRCWPSSARPSRSSATRARSATCARRSRARPTASRAGWPRSRSPASSSSRARPAARPRSSSRPPPALSAGRSGSRPRPWPRASATWTTAPLMRGARRARCGRSPSGTRTFRRSSSPRSRSPTPRRAGPRRDRGGAREAGASPARSGAASAGPPGSSPSSPRCCSPSATTRPASSSRRGSRSSARAARRCTSRCARRCAAASRCAAGRWATPRRTRAWRSRRPRARPTASTGCSRWRPSSEALVERGRPDEAERELERIGVPGALVRGAPTARCSTRAGGCGSRRAAPRRRWRTSWPPGATCCAASARTPSAAAWRSGAALAQLALGRPRCGAQRSAAEEVELRPRRRALRARSAWRCGREGLVAGGESGLALLEDSVSSLEDSQAQLELGQVARRAGRARCVAAAAAPTRASRCGARSTWPAAAAPTALAEQARTELRAARGPAAPGRACRGRGSLTASERRVAEMAAQGLSNREIAQALFVSLRTVETHLTHAFQKLGIDSRTKLADALRGHHDMKSRGRPTMRRRPPRADDRRMTTRPPSPTAPTTPATLDDRDPLRRLPAHGRRATGRDRAGRRAPRGRASAGTSTASACAGIAEGLHSLGLRRGDTLALLLTNRVEFHLLDAAAIHLGAVPFSVYTTSAPEQIEYPAARLGRPRGRDRDGPARPARAGARPGRAAARRARHRGRRDTAR